MTAGPPRHWSITPDGQRDRQRQQPRHWCDEENSGRRRFQTPLAAAHQDGCRGQDEGGKATQPV